MQCKRHPLRLERSGLVSTSVPQVSVRHAQHPRPFQSPGSLPSSKPSHNHNHSHSHCPGRCSLRCPAASEAASSSSSELLSMFHSSQRQRKLQGRGIRANPLEGLVLWAQPWLREGNLWASAHIDRHAWLPPLLCLCAAGATASGLGLGSLLHNGLPNWALLALYRGFDIIYFDAPYLLALAAAAALAAWSLRGWLGAQAQLMQHASSVLPSLQAQLQPTGAADAVEAAPSPPPPPAAAAEAGSAASSIAAGVGLVRWLLLCKACQLISRSCSLMPWENLWATAVPAALCTAAAVAPLLALAVAKPSAAATTSSSGTVDATKAAAAVLVLEATWLLAAAAGLPWAARAAAAAAGAAALQLLHMWTVAPQLQGYKGVAGDEAEVEIKLYLAGQAVEVDSTEGSGPVQVVVGAPRQQQQQGEDLVTRALEAEATDLYPVEVTLPPPGQAAPSTSSSGSAEGGESLSPAQAAAAAAGDQEQQQQEERAGARQLMAAAAAAAQDPQARWLGLLPDIAAALEGCSLGQEVALIVVNSGPLYYNPSYCWWQEMEDVRRKFRGHVPEAGEVFRYPVKDNVWLETQVTAVGSHHVELDANHGLEGQPLLVKAKLVKLVRHQA